MRKAGQGNILARLKILVLKVFSNDFATVDFREGLCYHSRPKKQKRRGMLQKRETEELYGGENL